MKSKFIWFYTISYIFALGLTCIILFLAKSNTKENQIIAEVIGAEACSEGVIGLYAVANTIKNRTIKYNKSPYEIVTQSNQYHGYINPNREKIYLTCKQDVDLIASQLTELIDITDGALYYLLPNEKENTWHKIKTVTIGNHRFYK